MKFTKDVAYIVLNFKDGYSYNCSCTRYLLSVTELVKVLQGTINREQMIILLDGDHVDGGDVESFEITNYEELLTLEVERNEEDEKAK